MTFPIELRSGNFGISAHFLFETLAFVVGFRYFLYLKRIQVDPISDRNRMWIIIGAAFGAFLFSRLLGSLENPSLWKSSTYPWLYFYSNKTIVGGLLGGLLCVEVTKYFLREKSSSGDLLTYPLILAMIVGRVGCFTSGVSEPTFGVASTLPWAMDLGDGILRHPVSLYEVVFLVLFWIMWTALEKKTLFEAGVRFKFFMIAYLVFRFLLDYIKPVHPVFATLSAIQIACLGGLAYYAKTWVRFMKDSGKLMQHAKQS